MGNSYTGVATEVLNLCEELGSYMTVSELAQHIQGFCSDFNDCSLPEDAGDMLATSLLFYLGQRNQAPIDISLAKLKRATIAGLAMP